MNTKFIDKCKRKVKKFAHRFMRMQSKARQRRGVEFAY